MGGTRDPAGRAADVILAAVTDGVACNRRASAYVLAVPVALGSSVRLACDRRPIRGMPAVAVALVVTWSVGIAAADRVADAQALASAEQAVAARPGDAGLRVKLAELLVQEQRDADARTAYEAAIQLDGIPPEPKFALATLYVRAGESMRAAALLRDIVRTSTNDAVVDRAGREAIDLAEVTATLGELENAMLPRAARPAHRRLLVELYGRWVPLLTRLANSREPAARHELLRIGNAALAPLLAALGDPDPRQQRTAIAVLAEVGNPAAAPALVALARGGPRAPVASTALDVANELRSDALVAAGRLGNPTVLGAVQPLMRHPARNIREAATFAVARIGARTGTGDRRAVASLIAALDDDSPVATLAGLGLARYREPRVGPALVTLVSDPDRDEMARAACAYAIGVQRVTAGAAALTGALEGHGELARIAAWSLGQLAMPATLGPVLRAYFARGGQQRSELELAIAALGGVPAPGAPALDPIAYPRTNGRYDAAGALSMLPGELPVPILPDRVFQAHAAELSRAIAHALSASDPAVVDGVLEDLDARPDALGFGALTPTALDAATRAALATVVTEIEPPLTGLLVSRESRVRVRALSIVTKAIGPRAEPAILRALDAPEREVREGAMAAIGQLARTDPVPAALRARIVQALASRSWPDRRAAALAIGNLGAAADVGALTAAASDPSGLVRDAVATSLGAIASPATVSALIQLSRDLVPEVRIAAAHALRSLADPRARKRVGELGRDPDPGVRAAAHP
jgi:HEAT repeat protein